MARLQNEDVARMVDAEVREDAAAAVAAPMALDYVSSVTVAASLNPTVPPSPGASS